MRDPKEIEKKQSGWGRPRGWRLVLPLVALGALVATPLQAARASASQLGGGGDNDVLNFQGGFSPMQQANHTRPATPGRRLTAQRFERRPLPAGRTARPGAAGLLTSQALR